MHKLDSALDLIERYDAFLLDLWGVVHDGEALYPGVLEVIAAMSAAGKQIVFLSNAPRRAERARDKLLALGVPAEAARWVVTSGEAAYHDLARNPRGWKRYVYIGPERDLDLLAGLDYHPAPPETADFVLNLGFTDDNEPVDYWLPLMKASFRHELPMICGNPDKIVVRQSGEVLPCAGQLAQLYQDHGGRVTWYGKPYPSVYAQCRALLKGIDPSRIVAIGDSLETDILGGYRAGIATALVTGGILKPALHPDSLAVLDAAALDALVAETGATPDYTMPGLAPAN